MFEQRRKGRATSGRPRGGMRATPALVMRSATKHRVCGLAPLFMSFCHYWVQQLLCPSCISLCITAGFGCFTLLVILSLLGPAMAVSFLSLCITAGFGCFTLLVILSLLGPAIAVSFLSLCITAGFGCFTLLVLSLLGPAIAVLPFSLSLSVLLQGLTASLFLSSHYRVQPLLFPSFLCLSLSISLYRCRV